MASTETLFDSDVLDRIINDAAWALRNRNLDLDWHWLDARNNIIDLVTHTIGLGMFSSFDHFMLRALHAHRLT